MKHKPGHAIVDRIARLKRELEQARTETSRLRRVLADVDLASLRRGVAYYCHPDRGGDALLMRRINALFDHLESASCR